jgi:Protein of unknown function (DUF3300)
MIATAALVFVMCGAPSAGTPRQAQADAADRLLAPIALYPDALLAQILLSASTPAKAVELYDWMKNNASLKGTELQDAAVKAGFDASFVALVPFPQVVEKMATNYKWTTELGQLFTADKSAVFASIQRLRHQAKQVGTLKSSPQQEVTSKTTSSGEDVIVIEPANPQVVYVPQYNSQVVYTQAPTNTTVVIKEDNTDEAVAAGLIGFTAGIAIGAAMNNNYYYSPYGWHGGAYMYNDAWDDYYDRREDAREDWQDHREDLSENRTERAGNAQEQRTERQQNTQGQRTERTQTRQENRPASTTAQASSRTGSPEARGYSGDGSKAQAAKERSGKSSDAFSGYSSGKSERASSSRGQSSRSSSRGGGGRRR